MNTAPKGEDKLPGKNGSPPAASAAQSLRQRAETVLRGRSAGVPDALSALSPEALQQIVEDLHVHQIELEMQNEELRRSQNELDRSRALYFDLYDMAPVGYCTVSDTGLIEQANLTACALLGMERSTWLRQPLSRFILTDDRGIYYQMQRRASETGESQSCELRLVKQDGSPLWAHLQLAKVQEPGDPMTLRLVLTNITERKLAEVSLRDSNAYLDNLLNYANAPIIVWDPQLRIERFNHAFELLSGRSEASVIGQPLEVLFPPERVEASMALIRQTRAGERWNRVEIDIQHQDQTIRHVQWNSATLLAPDGKTVLATIAQGQDITDRVRAEDRVRRYMAELKGAFLGTVDLATSLSSMRDPYNAGHERRVGDLALAICAELGFDEAQQERVMIAGLLHDIGKTGIPAEVLSKPGKLNAVEFRLVQEHVQVGHDVLKDVKFPWQIADIVLQHHERMDGSGYPNGLKGGAILLKARIVAVADVVEAMCSHRPHRSALGVAAALAEIEGGRGTLYDMQVVDACVKLFRDKGYAIPD